MNSPWTVLAMALVVLFFSWAAGTLGPPVWWGLLVVVLIGMLFPPLAIGLLGIALLWLIFAHGTTVLQKVTKGGGGKVG